MVRFAICTLEHPLMFWTYITMHRHFHFSKCFSRNKTVKKSFILNIYLIRSSKSIIGLWSMYIYLSVCVLSFEYALCRSIFRSKVFNEQWTSICDRSNLKIIQSNRISFNPNSLTVSITELEELCQATLIPLSSNKSMKHQSKCIPFSST